MLCLNETRYDSTIEDMNVKIDGYILAARCDRVPDNAGGGSAIYVRNGVNFHSVRVKSLTHNCQLTSIQIKNLTILCTYRNPHKNKAADKMLINHVKRYYSGKKLLWVGDLNLTGFDWSLNNPRDSDKETLISQWEDIMVAMDLQQLVNEETYITGSQLDVAIVNTLDDILVSYPVVDWVFGESLADTTTGLVKRFTDHALIKLQVNVIIDQTANPRYVFDKRKMDWNKYRRLLNESSIFEIIAEIKDVNHKWVYLRDTLLKLRFQCCPLKRVGLSVKSPWINENLLKDIRKNRRLKAAKSKGDARAKRKKCWAWKKHSDALKNKILQSRYSYEHGVISALKFDKNAVYNYIKRIKNCHMTPPINDINGKALNTADEKADAFQSKFLGIYGEDENLDIMDFWHCEAAKNDPEFLNSITINKDMIIDAVKRTRANVAPGVDSLSGDVYKQGISVLWPALQSLFQAMLDKKRMPFDFMINKVTPLFKGSGVKSDISRWRPLSLGIICLRILERILDKLFRLHLSRIKFLPCSQHGFREKRSCVTNLISSWNYICEKNDRKVPMGVLSLDGTAAFDKIKFSSILESLYEAKIAGDLGHFIQVWLQQRFQFVQVEQESSYLDRCFSGTPQGSVLSPLLYAVASADSRSKDIKKIQQLGGKLYQYADDCRAVFPLKSSDELAKAQKMLWHFDNYAHETGLQFNAGKSQLLLIGSYIDDVKLELSGNEIKPAKQILDLGVKFNERLNFTTHMELVIAKAKRVIAMVRHNLSVRNTNSLKILYQMYYQPSITYGCQLWFNSEDGTINKLEELDKKFWKLGGSFIVRPKVLSTVQFVVVQCLMLYFDYKHGKAVLELEDDFKNIEHGFDTRLAAQDPSHLSKPRVETKRKEFVYNTSRLFNLLDPLKRKTENRNEFKKLAQAMAKLKF